MADGFIVRKGGVTTEQATMPTILNITDGGNQISFEIKNNDTQTAVILFEVDDTTPDANSLELAGGATSETLRISKLDELETYIVYATANVTGKVKSEVASQSITTSTIIYTAATGGTTEEYNDVFGKRYRSHTFTSNGNFAISTVGNGDRSEVNYLIIGGGGAGGYNCGAAGGGGAGGYITTHGPSGGNTSAVSKEAITASTYGITIGAGGAGGQSNTDGNNSIIYFDTPIISFRGERGGGTNLDPRGDIGSGGGSHANDNTNRQGTTGQGTQGGASTITTGGAGGGGTGFPGNNRVNTGNAPGGNGLANTLRTGFAETRGGGGGGGSNDSGTVAGTGGLGGGGNGRVRATNTEVAFPGQTNTGSGGGGGGARPLQTCGGGGGAGGSGIVVIQYEIAPTT